MIEIFKETLLFILAKSKLINMKHKKTELKARFF